MKKKDVGELVTIQEASRMVKVSRRTIYNWLTKEKLRFIRTAGGSVRIYADSLWRDGDKKPDPTLKIDEYRNAMNQLIQS